MGLTGVSSTTGIGSVEITETQLVLPSGVSFASSVGEIIPEIGVPITGLSFTSSVGTLSPADVMGLTGIEITGSVAANIGIQAYQEIDTGSNSSYNNVATGSNTSYSDVA